jgi:hypothetical protein
MTQAPGSLASNEDCGSVAADSTLPYVYYGVGYESDTGSIVFGYLLDQASGALTQIETAPVPASTMGVVAVTHRTRPQEMLRRTRESARWLRL